jgi:predicted ATP-dependent serine protease
MLLRGLIIREATADELASWTCMRCALRNQTHLGRCGNCNRARLVKRARSEAGLSDASFTKMIAEYPFTSSEKDELCTWCSSNDEGTAG